MVKVKTVAVAAATAASGACCAGRRRRHHVVPTRPPTSPAGWRFADIERARTVFEWGPAPSPAADRAHQAILRQLAAPEAPKQPTKKVTAP